MRISDWSSDVCSSDLIGCGRGDSAGPDQPACAAPCLRHAPSGRRRGPTRRAGDAWPRRHRDDGNLYPCPDQGAGRTRRIEASRSEEHTSELQSLMRISYAVFCLKKKKKNKIITTKPIITYIITT